MGELCAFHFLCTAYKNDKRFRKCFGRICRAQFPDQFYSWKHRAVSRSLMILASMAPSPISAVSLSLASNLHYKKTKNPPNQNKPPPKTEQSLWKAVAKSRNCHKSPTPLAAVGVLFPFSPPVGVSILRPGGCTPGMEFTICSKKKCSLFITMDKALKSCPRFGNAYTPHFISRYLFFFLASIFL